jgi:hypothetical protein
MVEKYPSTLLPQPADLEVKLGCQQQLVDVWLVGFISYYSAYLFVFFIMCGLAVNAYEPGLATQAGVNKVIIGAAVIMVLSTVFTWFWSIIGFVWLYDVKDPLACPGGLPFWEEMQVIMIVVPCCSLVGMWLMWSALTSTRDAVGRV